MHHFLTTLILSVLLRLSTPSGQQEHYGMNDCCASLHNSKLSVSILMAYGIFTPQKLANTKNQGFIYCVHCLDWGQQTTAYWPNLACNLFLYDPEVFKELWKGGQKEEKKGTICGPQSVNYLLSGFLLKNFDNPCIHLDI